MNPDNNNYSSSPSSTGIYLDENYISALVLINGKTYPALPATPANISFFDSEIKIGLKALPEEFPLFWLYNLIKQSSSEHIMKKQCKTITLTSEDILTTFFLEMCKLIQRNVNIDMIGSTSLAVPFWLSSLEKERLKFAMDRAGFKPLRIIPSSLAAAVMYKQNLNLTISPNQSNQILIIHGSYRTFSITNAQIEDNEIVPLEIIQPERNESDEFWSWHCRLYRNQTMDTDKLNFIKVEYKECLNRLKNRVFKEVFVIRRATESSELDKLILSFFPSNTVKSMYLSNELLVGGAILASNAKWCTNSFNNLAVRIDLEALHKPFVYPNFAAGEYLKIMIRSNEDLITTSEIFQEKLYPVGQYKVLVQNCEKGPAIFGCRADEDGILAVALAFENGSSNGQILRQNDFRMKPSGLRALQAHYAACKELGRASEDTRNSTVQKEEPIKQAFEKAFNLGLAHYRKKMKELSDRAEPMTDKDITSFHEKLRQAILYNFDAAFQNPTSLISSLGNPRCKKWLQEARGRLESGTSSLLSVYMKRYEVQMQRHTSKVEECMLEMEEAYDQNMEKKHSWSFWFGPQKNHDQLVKELTEKFRDLLEEKRLEIKENMVVELRNRLSERSQQFGISEQQKGRACTDTSL